MAVTEVLALIGVITGPLGLLLASIVYFRDRAIVSVRVKWDMVAVEPISPEKTTFIITVSNIGRRAIHLSGVRLEIPSPLVAPGNSLMLVQGLSGDTLAEGSQPLKVEGDQACMEKYASVWWRVRAAADDTARKAYYSDWPIEPASWAKDVRPPLGAIAWNRIRNWGRKPVL